MVDTNVEARNPETGQRQSIRKVVVSAGVGNFIEWYDLAIYAYAAAGISHSLFPSDGDAGLAVVMTMAVFSVTYVLRPIAGVIMGTIGDRVGRKKLLVLTITLMAIATLGIGVIPDYAVIGVVAPILLVVCRAAQGISAGGEFIGAATYVYENAPPGKKGATLSLIQLGTGLSYPFAAFTGFVLANSLGDEAFLNWGWRIPFLLAAPLGLVAWFIRRRLDESPEFLAIRKAGLTAKRPLAEAFRDNPLRLVLAVVFIMGFSTGAVTILFYLPSYLSVVAGYDPQTAALAMGCTTLLFALSIPAWGPIVDRIGHGRARLIVSATMVVVIIPAFWLILQGSPVLLAVGLGTLAVGQGLYYAVAPLTAVELFPAKHRYTSGTIAYNVPIATLFATFPALAASMVISLESPIAPAFLAAAGFGIGVIGAIGLKLNEQRFGGPLA
jgi:MHS family proline/betaine transporter-like MFS transporter